MRLSAARFLADENIDPQVIAYLRENAYDVLSVHDAGLRGGTDTRIMGFALEQERVILTHDSDFGALAVGRGQSTFGIVYIRPGQISPEFTIATLKAVLAMHIEVHVPFIAVAERRGEIVRMRLRNIAAI